MATTVVTSHTVGGTVLAIEVGGAGEREGEGYVSIASVTNIFPLWKREREGEREEWCERERGG